MSEEHKTLKERLKELGEDAQKAAKQVEGEIAKSGISEKLAEGAKSLEDAFDQLDKELTKGADELTEHDEEHSEGEASSSGG